MLSSDRTTARARARVVSFSLMLTSLGVVCGLLGCRLAPSSTESSVSEDVGAPPAPVPLTRDDAGFFATPHEGPRGKPSDRFPNTLLVGTDGKRYRFYEDLVRDRIVIVQFMYTTCTGI